MATRAELLRLSVEVANRAAIRALEQFERKSKATAAKSKTAFDQFTGSVNKLRNALYLGGAAAMVVGGVRALDKFIERGRRVNLVADGFENLTSKIGKSERVLEQLREATQGLVSDFDLMRQANQALALGLPVTATGLADLLSGARRLSRALGQDVAFGIESVVTGIGRQSRLMLDNLGIIVSTTEAADRYARALGTASEQLSTFQRRVAFTREAQRKMRDTLEDLGPDMIDSADLWAQLKVEARNAADAIAAAATAGTQVENTLENQIALLERDLDLRRQRSQLFGVRGELGALGLPGTEGTQALLDKKKEQLAVENALLKLQADLGPLTLATADAYQMTLEALGPEGISKWQALVADKVAEHDLNIKGIRDKQAELVEQHRKEREELDKKLPKLREEVALAERKMQLARGSGFGDPVSDPRIDDPIFGPGLGQIVAYNHEIEILMENVGHLPGLFQHATVMTREHAAAIGELGFTALETSERYAQGAAMIINALGPMFGKSKAFAIAQAIVSTWQAVNLALATPPGPPATIPFAAAIAAIGLANVAKIRSTSPGSSGGAAGFGAVGSFGGAGVGFAAQTGPQRNVEITIIVEGSSGSEETAREVARQVERQMSRAGRRGF